MKDIELPPLPEPDICRYVVTVWRDGVECEIDNGPRYTVEQMQAYARRIESAATAPLLDRIAELEKDCDRFERYWNEAMATHKNIAKLERQLAEARKDAERYRLLRYACCEGYPSGEGSSRKDAYLVITGYDDLYPMTDAQKDAAIDAAFKEQT